MELAGKKAAASKATASPDATSSGASVKETKSCWRQMKVLTKKNMLLQWRNKAATGAQVCVGWHLVLMLMDVAVTQNSRSNACCIPDLDHGDRCT